MIIQLAHFSSTEHLSSTVEAIHNLREVDPSYPSPIDTGSSKSDLEEWLLDETFIFRTVALANSRVVGHIGLVQPHTYLQDYLTTNEDCKYIEVSKFFVDPTGTQSGIGRLLFSRAVAEAQSLKLKPILAVLESSHKAYRFYNKAGFEEIGSFQGTQGKNFVFALK